MLYNKIDLLPKHERPMGILRDGQGKVVAVNLSVLSGAGLDDLRLAMQEWADTL